MDAILSPITELIQLQGQMQGDIRHGIHIIRYLTESGEATTRTLGQRLGLSKSSLSRLMRRLLDAQVVQAIETQDGSLGRPAQVYRLNPGLAYALGVELGESTANWVLVDAAGDVIREEKFASVPPATNAAFLQRMEDIVVSALEASCIDPERLLCIGVALHGFIDQKTATCVYCPTMPGPQNIPVGSYLRQRFGLPVVLLEEGRCVAVVESHRGSARGIRNFIVVEMDESISAGIVVNGQLYLGESGMAGQLAHIAVDPAGPRCICGVRGCLEVVASTRAITDSVHESLSSHALITTDFEGHAPSIERIAQAAEEGDSLCFRTLNRAGELLGIGIATLSKILNIDYVVMFGTLPRQSTVLMNAVRRSVKLNSLPLVEPEIAVSSLPAYAAAQGVAIYALGKQLSEHAEALLAGRMQAGRAHRS